MKIVLLMYLEDDDEAVMKLLEAEGVAHWSRMPLEGHSAGTAGWYGHVAPYRSRMILTVMPSPQANGLIEAISACTECQDPSHPIHALQVDVERAVQSGTPPLSAL